MEKISCIPNHDPKECTANVTAVRDALYVLNGKWKLPLIAALSDGGAMRFKDIERALDGITPKILSKELKELELNEFLIRKVYPSTPVMVTYELTPYSSSLERVMEELRQWGLQHRQKIIETMKKQAVTKESR